MSLAIAPSSTASYGLPQSRSAAAGSSSVLALAHAGTNETGGSCTDPAICSISKMEALFENRPLQQTTSSMRYQNWDILLFPGGSRVPIQEFDTKFHVLTSSTKPAATSTALEDPFTDDTTYRVFEQLPLLTCFIPSQPRDSPFRVSIHSWTKPLASSGLSACRTKEEVVGFQARLYLDGIFQWFVIFLVPCQG
jgi:hypothetical protein